MLGDVVSRDLVRTFHIMPDYLLIAQCLLTELSKLGWQLGLAFVLRGKNMHFLRTSVRYLGRIGS